MAKEIAVALGNLPGFTACGSHGGNLRELKCESSKSFKYAKELTITNRWKQVSTFFRC
jgi:hypothetical protein